MTAEITSETNKAKATQSEDSRAILPSFVSLGGGLLLARAIAFLGTAYLTRTLGPYGFGVIGFATAICAFFAQSAHASFCPVGSREIARNPNAAASTAGGVILVRLGVATLAIALVGATVLLLNKPSQVDHVILLTSLTMISQAFGTGWVYKGLGKNRNVGIGLALTQTVYVVALFVAVRDPSDVVWVPIALVIGELVTAVYLGIPLFRRSQAKPDIAEGLRILRASKYLVLSKLSYSLTRTIDIVLLSLLVGETSVGLYAAAYRLCLLVQGIGQSLQTAYVPSLSRAARESAASVDQIVRRAIEAATFLALPLVAGGVICSPELLGFLFGAEFAPAAGVFNFLIVGTGIFFINAIAQTVFLVFDQTRADMRIRASATAVNLILNLMWIPKWGVLGAGAATLLSQLLIMLLSGWTCKRLGVHMISGISWKAVVATFVMAVFLLLAPENWALWLRILIGGVVYLASTVIIRGIPVDLRWRT